MQQRTQTYEANTNKTEGRYRQQQNSSRGFQHVTLNNGQNTQT